MVLPYAQDGIHRFLSLFGEKLRTFGVPEHFYPTIMRKLEMQVYDAAMVFKLETIDYSSNQPEPTDPVLVTKACRTIRHKDPEQIYLVDTVWHSILNRARLDIRQYASIRHRLFNFMCHYEPDVRAKLEEMEAADPNKIEQHTDMVWEAMWRFNHMEVFRSYIGSTTRVNGEMTLWHVLHELGSSIVHSDNPNCRLVQFHDESTDDVYTLLFPIKDIAADELMTRDFAPAASIGTDDRRARLYPWYPKQFTECNFEQIEPDLSYFDHVHADETLPVPSALKPPVGAPGMSVYMQNEELRKYLTDGAFYFVDYEGEAVIQWRYTRLRMFREFSQLTPNIFINQFPCERVITHKAILPIICRRAIDDYMDPVTLETNPRWLPTTFSLDTEMPKFISYFKAREARGLDNHWIVKPIYMGREYDRYVGKNLAQLIRLHQPENKIVQKYVENPVTFYRTDLNAHVKFDIFYYVILKRTEPLEAYVHTNFDVCFANKKFSLDSYDDREKHFTYLAYDTRLQQMPGKHFLKLWRQQQTEHWETIEREIRRIIGQVLKKATMLPPPRGIGASPQSRALYAAEITLGWCNDGNGRRIQPKLMEIHFAPDCELACKHYPNFYNEIFRLLFLDQPNERVFMPVILR